MKKSVNFSFSRTLGGKAACFGSKDPTPPAFANQDRGSAVLAAPIGHAVTFMSAADPTFNTTPPTGALAGSGWQYEATFSPFLATAMRLVWFPFLSKVA